MPRKSMFFVVGPTKFRNSQSSVYVSICLLKIRKSEKISTTSNDRIRPVGLFRKFSKMLPHLDSDFAGVFRKRH